MKDSIKNTKWHCLLGSILKELLTPLDITVLTEVPVLTQPPEADIILIRRHGDHWSESQKSWLADGIRDTSAKEVLIEFKYSESMNEDGVLQALMYDRLYLHHQKLKREHLQSYLILSKTPHAQIMERFEYGPTATSGLYTSEGLFVHALPVILLNELADQPHNAIFKCFASRHKEQKMAFEVIDKLDTFKISNKLERLIIGLWRILMPEVIEDPDVVGWTPESVMQLGQDWIDAVLRTTPAEELFKLPEAVKRMERVQRETAERVQRETEKRVQRETEKRVQRETELRTFHKLFQHRFGPAPEWVNVKLAEVDLETLETWTWRILDADSLHAVFQ